MATLSRAVLYVMVVTVRVFSAQFWVFQGRVCAAYKIGLCMQTHLPSLAN